MDRGIEPRPWWRDTVIDETLAVHAPVGTLA
jgi:hypothetical protein